MIFRSRAESTVIWRFQLHWVWWRLAVAYTGLPWTMGFNWPFTGPIDWISRNNIWLYVYIEHPYNCTNRCWVSSMHNTASHLPCSHEHGRLYCFGSNHTVCPNSWCKHGIRGTGRYHSVWKFKLVIKSSFLLSRLHFLDFHSTVQWPCWCSFLANNNFDSVSPERSKCSVR